MREGALSRRDAEALVEAAVAAPSMHNLQPWRFVARLSERVVEIYADPARALRGADPRGRAVHIACGAALFNLRLAVAHSGAEPIARLLPNPRDPLLLASVRVAGPHRSHPGERELHAAMHAALRVGRAEPGLLPLSSRQALPGLLPALAEAAMLEGASLRMLDRAEALRVVQSIMSADRSAHADPRHLAELSEFTPGPPGRPGRQHSAALEGGGHLALLSTPSDDRASWLRAGQALQRVLLLAMHRGVPAGPLSPVMVRPEGQRPDPRTGAGYYPEMILRLGAEPAGVARSSGSRRPVSQVMRVVSGAPARQDEGPRRAPPPALSPAPRELMPSK